MPAEAARQATRPPGSAVKRPGGVPIRTTVQALNLRPFHQKLHLALALPLVHIEAEG